VPYLRDPRVRLILTSGALLFTELLLIRWIPSTVKYVGFFTNFLLMASFLGIGLGILLGRSGRKLAVSPFAWLLFMVVLLVLLARLDVQVKSTDQVFFGLHENESADTNFIVLPLVFTYSFRDTKIADMAFASNLLGAMLGGVVEYLALISGYRFLLVVVAGLYLTAWLFATRARVLADVSLTLDAEAA
jgi:hypothetical protein